VQSQYWMSPVALAALCLWALTSAFSALYGLTTSLLPTPTSTTPSPPPLPSPPPRPSSGPPLSTLPPSSSPGRLLSTAAMASSPMPAVVVYVTVPDKATGQSVQPPPGKKKNMKSECHERACWQPPSPRLPVLPSPMLEQYSTVLCCSACFALYCSGQKLAGSIVESKLAACVNRVPGTPYPRNHTISSTAITVSLLVVMRFPVFLYRDVV